MVVEVNSPIHRCMPVEKLGICYDSDKQAIMRKRQERILASKREIAEKRNQE